MGAILNMLQTAEVIDRQENASGAFAGAFFANQGLDCGAGHVPTMEELTLAGIRQRANRASMPLDDILALLKGQQDASELKA